MSRQAPAETPATGCGHGDQLRQRHHDRSGHKHGAGEVRDRVSTGPSRLRETCRETLPDTLVGRSENGVTLGTLDGDPVLHPAGSAWAMSPLASAPLLLGAEAIRMAASTGVDDGATTTLDRRVKVKQTGDWDSSER